MIDWATTMFTHPEFDIAVSRSILSIGPPEDVGIPPEELQQMLDWATVEYMKHCHELQTIDDSLVDYYSALRLSHAYVKVHAKRLGIEHSEVAHEGYAWNAPKQYAAVTRMINEITGIELESA